MGLIRNAKQVTQAVDFSGVQNGVIHPSDIDAVLEFNNEALILMEIKRKNNIIPTGQRLMLERIVDRWEKGIVLKIEHEHYDIETPIPLNKCIVTHVYFEKSWKPCQIPVVNYLQQLGVMWNIEKLKKIS